MSRIEEPRPRGAGAEPPLRWRPALGARVKLPVGNELSTPLDAILEKRASSRRLTAPSREALAALLWHGARTRSLAQGQERRASPSAGGIHPINLLLLESPFTSAALYDPVSHALTDLVLHDPTALAVACSSFAELLPHASGVFLLGVAEKQRTAAVYEYPESLLWRDAGCLFGTLHLTATALGLGSCLMGILGVGIAEVIANGPELVPVGAMAVGMSSD